MEVVHACQVTFYFSRGNFLSLAGKGILLKISVLRDIHRILINCHWRAISRLFTSGGGGGGGVLEKGNCMVLLALGNICMTTHSISHYYVFFSSFYFSCDRGTSDLTTFTCNLEHSNCQ